MPINSTLNPEASYQNTPPVRHDTDSIHEDIKYGPVGYTGDTPEYDTGMLDHDEEEQDDSDSNRNAQDTTDIAERETATKGSAKRKCDESAAGEDSSKRHKKDKIDGDEDEAGPSPDAEPQKKGAKNKEKGEVPQKNKESEISNERKANDFFKDAHFARLGVMNSVRINKSGNPVSNLAWERIRDEKAYDLDLSQDEDGQQLESFFRDPSIEDANMRIDYVKPYTKMKDGLGKWHFLSTKMRLNLIEGLQMIGPQGKPKKEAKNWERMQEKARPVLRMCVKNQMNLGHPFDWIGYRRAERTAGDETKRAREVFGDEVFESSGAKSDSEGQNKPLAKTEPQTKSRLKTTTKKTKKLNGAAGITTTPESWHDVVWTDEQEKRFQELLDDPARDNPADHAGRSDSANLSYSNNELYFCDRFIRAKNQSTDTKWAKKSDMSHAFSRAHRLWFIDYPETDPKTSKQYSPERKPDALYRKLIKDPEFKVLTEAAEKEEKKAQAAKHFTQKAKTSATTIAESSKSTNETRVANLSADEGEDGDRCLVDEHEGGNESGANESPDVNAGGFRAKGSKGVGGLIPETTTHSDHDEGDDEVEYKNGRMELVDDDEEVDATGEVDAGDEVDDEDNLGAHQGPRGNERSTSSEDDTESSDDEGAEQSTIEKDKQLNEKLLASTHARKR